jgi:hypothetical protein
MFRSFFTVLTCGYLLYYYQCFYAPESLPSTLCFFTLQNVTRFHPLQIGLQPPSFLPDLSVPFRLHTPPCCTLCPLYRVCKSACTVFTSLLLLSYSISGLPLTLFPMFCLCIYTTGICTSSKPFTLFQTCLSHSKVRHFSPVATKYPHLLTFPILSVIHAYMYSVNFIRIRVFSRKLLRRMSSSMTWHRVVWYVWRRFSVICFLHHEVRWRRQQNALKYWYNSTRLHGVTSQNTVTFILRTTHQHRQKFGAVAVSN